MRLNRTLLPAVLSLCAASSALANTQATKEIPGVAPQSAGYLYTGKPYDVDLEAYTFKHRNYDPAINRWTSVDPSGFSDGANNNIYAPVPTSALDPLGLWTVAYAQGVSNTVDPLTFTNSGNEYKVTMRAPSAGGDKATAMALMAAHMGSEWQIVNVGSSLGNLTINSAAPSGGSNQSIAGAGFTSVFSATASAIGSYQIVQIVTTNVPMAGQTANTYLDITASSPHPFYSVGRIDGRTLEFGDGSTRYLTDAATSKVTWDAYSFLVDYDVNNKIMSVYDGGMKWGWTLAKE